MYEVPFEVKQALKKGIYKKNYRFNILNDDETVDFTIDNDTLVKESVKFDERMASGNELKFGLCEGTSLEFQYFNHDNITGRRLQAFIDVEYVESNNSKQWHTIPMGFFTVDKCPMQFSTGIRKVTAFNKLMSKYLDQKANSFLIDSFSSGSADILIYDIQDILLNGYQIEHEIKPIEPIEGSIFAGDTVSFSLNMPFFFTQIEGLKTPLSGYEYDNGGGPTPTLQSEIYLYFISGALRYEVTNDSAYWELRQNYGDLAVFEQNVYERLYYVMDSAKLRTNSTIAPFNGGLVDGQMFVDFLCKNVGFQNIFSIKVKYENEDPEYYSTIQWNYEEANNIAHTVKGTFTDFANSTKKGEAILDVIIPARLDGLYSKFTTGSEPSFTTIPFGESKIFRYWLHDYEHSSSGTLWIHPIKYGDGTDYSLIYREDFSTNMDEAITVGTIELSEAEKIEVNTADLEDFTLRDIISAVFETQCQYGQLDRETDLFSGVELNDGGLYPAETLYPATGLYPNASYSKSNFHPFPSEYEKLWTDTVGAQTFKYLIITYKTTITDSSGNIQEVEKTLQRTVNTNGTTNYNMSDNWLFKNLIWTADQVGEYADAMVEKMRGITWFPFEMWAAGLPYVETGDMIEITDKAGDTYTSYVLQRQLNGIHNLKDTYINGELDIF